MYKIGDKVKFQFYNTPDGIFYGPVHEGEVIGNAGLGYKVRYDTGGIFTEIEIDLREIVRGESITKDVKDM